MHAEVLVGLWAHSCTVLNHKSSFRKQKLPAGQSIATLLCVMGIRVECTHTGFPCGGVARVHAQTQAPKTPHTLVGADLRIKKRRVE